MTRHVHLLGRLRIEAGADSWEPPSHLTAALLAYVAHHGDWVDRGALAALFWPEADQSGALTNLRSLLARSKREPFAEGLEIEPTRVRWPVSSDVAEFRAAIDDGRRHDAIRRYRGPLLEGMAFDASPAFDTWLELTRENLKDAYQTSALQVARDLHHADRVDEALAIVRDLSEREPLDEAAAQLTMRLYAESGRPDSAMRTYQAFARRLRNELQLEPSSATTTLLSDLERDIAEPRAASAKAADLPAPGPAATLPPSLTPFFGRDREIDEAVAHLEQSDCKLLTVTGPGGVGKTRMAIVVAERLRDRYADGMAFVPLESESTAEDVPTAIATALRLTLRSRERSDVQLIRGIGDRRMLLVLDNFEHLLDATELVTRLLVSCRGLDVLVTSRERLGLPSERLVDLRGLPYPRDPIDARGAERFPAVTLLYSRIRQVRPDVPVGDDTLEPVVEICRLVQGLPLALELAAVWAKSCPLAEIATEIGRNLDFLSFGPSASSTRHRSVRAAFEHSWKLLTPREREAMRKLSVFRGGFRRSAAAFVADASIAVLAALVDKSLLRVSLDGRYDCHPLIAAFAQEKLHGAPESERRARRRHAEYLAWLLEQAQPSFSTARGGTWVERLGHERENLSAAMEFALEERDAELGAKLVTLLRWVYWPWGFISSRRHLVDALVDLEGDVRPDVKAPALNIKGVLALTEGDIDAAVGAYEDAIRLANPALMADLILMVRSNLAYIERDRGRFEAAREHFTKAIELMDRAGETPPAANVLNNLATVERYEGHYESARKRHRRALEIGRSLGVPLTICQALNGLAYVERDLGRDDAARALLEESLGLARTHQISASIIACNNALGRLARRSGGLEASRRHHREALTTLRDTRTFRLLDRTLDAAADLLAAAGSAEAAVRVWHAAQSDRSARNAAEPKDAPPDRPRLKQEAGQALDATWFEHAANGGVLDRDTAIAAALDALARIEAGGDADRSEL